MMTLHRFVDLRQRRIFRRATIVGFLTILGVLSACQTQQQRVAVKEDNLAAAGFISRPANRFVQSVREDRVQYVYADPLVCSCLFVGSQQAYSDYQQNQQQQHLVDEQPMTAQTYSDTAWNWDAWGPRGPWEPRDQFEYGMDW